MLISRIVTRTGGFKGWAPAVVAQEPQSVKKKLRCFRSKALQPPPPRWAGPSMNDVDPNPPLPFMCKHYITLHAAYRCCLRFNCKLQKQNSQPLPWRCCCGDLGELFTGAWVTSRSSPEFPRMFNCLLVFLTSPSCRCSSKEYI